jgi:hypothetical protein
MTRVWCCIAIAASACSLDFDALERGSDAARSDAGRFDAGFGRRDAGSDAAVDAEGFDAGAELDAGAVDAGPPPDCPLSGGLPVCIDPRCEGVLCDDGVSCTDGERCTGGVCTGGAPVVCPSDGCSMPMCEEPTRMCRAGAAAPDTTPCPAGRCCYGRCSTLRDSAHCGGCNLPCDEETCVGSGPARCICVTNAGCPMGQTCSGGLCTCSDSSQCAAGQTCVSGGGFGYCVYP